MYSNFDLNFDMCLSLSMRLHVSAVSMGLVSVSLKFLIIAIIVLCCFHRSKSCRSSFFLSLVFVRYSSSCLVSPAFLFASWVSHSTTSMFHCFLSALCSLFRALSVSLFSALVVNHSTLVLGFCGLCSSSFILSISKYLAHLLSMNRFCEWCRLSIRHASASNDASRDCSSVEWG